MAHGNEINSKRYYWMKMERNFFKDARIKKLRRLAGGDTYTIIYLELMLLSIELEGKLVFEGIEKTFEEEMASKINEWDNLDNVKICIQWLMNEGILLPIEDGDFQFQKINIGSETQGNIYKKQKAMEKPKTQLPKPIVELENKEFKIGDYILPNLKYCKRLSTTDILLPNGRIQSVDEKRYGGNGGLVVDRAMGKCEICGSDENLLIHHKNGFSNELNDLIFVCSKCHGKLHSNQILTKFQPNSNQILIEKEKDIEKDIDIDNYNNSPNNDGKNAENKSLEMNTIFEEWNKMTSTIHHKELNDVRKQAIKKVLIKYSVQDIIQAIRNYDYVLRSDWYFNYKWSLEDFLNRKNGISTFTNEGSNWNSFQEDLKKNPMLLPKEDRIVEVPKEAPQVFKDFLKRI